MPYYMFVWKECNKILENQRSCELWAYLIQEMFIKYLCVPGSVVGPRHGRGVRHGAYAKVIHHPIIGLTGMQVNGQKKGLEEQCEQEIGM